MLFSACAPKNTDIKSSPNPQKPSPLNFDVPVNPTIEIPNEPGQQQDSFQAPPDKAVSKDNNTVVLNSASIKNSRLNYNSISNILLISGEIQILDTQKNVIAKKNFSLIGTQEKKSASIALYDENDNKDLSIIVRAQATCIGSSISDLKVETDCSHIIVDIFAKYQEKTFSVQVEATSKPQIETPPNDSKSDSQEPNPTAPEDLQPEDPDQSVKGSYPNTIPTIDVSKLFQPPPPQATAPAPSEPATPVEPEPKKPDTMKTPPQDPPAVKPEVPADSPNPEPHPPIGDKKISDELLETPEGLIRPYNQSKGFPNEGMLYNSTSLLTTMKTKNNSNFFEISFSNREKYYATFEMSELVLQAGKFLNEILETKLFVSSLSLKNGGPVSPHVSHQNGLDVDLGYPNNDGVKFPVVSTMKPHKFHTHNYSTKKTYEFLKYLFLQNNIQVDRIFIDQFIIEDLCRHSIETQKSTADIQLARSIFENIQHVAGHGDHFHVRIKCSTRDISCRSRIYKKMNNCSI